MANTAPTLDTSLNLSLTAIPNTISAANNLGIAVDDLIDNIITDADADMEAIAITQIDNSAGTWEYSLDGGTTWVAMNNLSETNALVLGATPLYAPGANGGTPEPDEQAWLSFSRLAENPLAVPGGTETPTDAGTTVDTQRVGNAVDTYAGYSNYSVNFLTQEYTLKNDGFPDLNLDEGFEISFELQVVSNVLNNNDRAAFSIVVVAADGQTAIEIGFQRTGAGTGPIFAQSDDVTPNPGGEPTTLFTSAEEVAFDTTTSLVRYTLAVSGNTYSLQANGTEILTGPMRNYTSFVPPTIGGLSGPNPYNVDNLVYLGDNSTSAGGVFTLGDVSLTTETRVRFVPNANSSGTSSFSFRAWDGSDGSAPGEQVDTTLNGGETAFSTAIETATIAVTNPQNKVGGAGADVLIGDARINRLDGQGGNDLLVGLGNNDTLLGGSGNDTLNGGLGRDTQTGGTGADVFRYQGNTLLAAHQQSLVNAPDWLQGFSAVQGDRIQLDYDNNLSTANRPIRLFQAGLKGGASLAAAAQNAFADKNQRLAGAQRLRAREAVFFRYGAQTYLAVNDAQQAFSASRDLIIRMTGMQYQGTDAKRGILSVTNYFR